MKGDIMNPNANEVDAPVTVVGQWLYASATFAPQQVRQRLSNELNGGTAGINADEPAVLDAACELALARAFPGTQPDAEIAHFVSVIQRHTSADAPTADELETVTRATLSAPGSPVEGFTIGRVFVIRSVIFAAACQKSRMKDADVARLVRDAETLAFERGWKPPVAL